MRSGTCHGQSQGSHCCPTLPQACRSPVRCAPCSRRIQVWGSLRHVHLDLLLQLLAELRACGAAGA